MRPEPGRIGRARAMFLAGLALAGWPGMRVAEAAAGWIPCGWGGGGHYWACAFDPRGNGTLYLGGDVAGVYASRDDGRTWTFINHGLADYAVYALGVAPSNPKVLVAGTPSGLCRTDDGGRAWRPLPETGAGNLKIFTDRPRSISPVAFDPRDARKVFAGSAAGRVYASIDGGEHWTLRHDFGPGVVTSVAVAPVGRTVLAMHATAGLARSADGGATWAPCGGPRGGSDVAFSPRVAGLAFAAGGEDGTWKSVDGGKSWTRLTPGPEAGWSIRQVVPHPGDGRILWCLGAKGWGGVVMRSDDGGSRWTVARRLRKGPANPTLPDEGSGGLAGEIELSALSHLAVDPARPDRLYVAGNWRNAWSADGGRTWEEREHGADISVITDIQFSGTRTLVTAMDEGLLASADQGATWKQLAPRKYAPEVSGHQWRVRVLDPGTGRRLVSTISLWDPGSAPPNRVLMSDDGGGTFIASAEGLPAGSTGRNTMWGRAYARALEVDPADPRTVYLGIDGDPDPAAKFPGGGVYRSRDGGRTWARLPHQPGSLRMFYGLAVSPAAPRTLYWGACGEQGGLWRSRDAGESWARVFTSEPWVFNVMVSPTGVVYASGQDVWRSADEGATWMKLTAFSGMTVVGLAVDPVDERRLWCSRVTWDSRAQGGVYRSVDGGGTWEEITGDLPYVKPLVLRYNPATRDLWAGGSGLFRIAQ